MAFMIDLFKHVGGMLSPILDWNPYTIQRDHLACLSGPSEVRGCVSKVWGQSVDQTVKATLIRKDHC